MRRSPGAFTSLRLTVLLLGSLIMPAAARAQVGHPPAASPYRDIRRGHTITPMAGYFFGNGGRFNVAPHDGMVIGGRYDIRSSHAIGLGLGVFYGDLQRFIVNPSLSNARTGPVDQSVTFIELDMQMNPAGNKSWHRLAPFFALGGGLAISSSTPADTSRFDFGDKFYFVPSAGFRLFLTQRLHLRGEGRATFWKITYPTTFLLEPSGTTFTEWTTSWWVQGGLGYSLQ